MYLNQIISLLTYACLAKAVDDWLIDLVDIYLLELVNLTERSNLNGLNARTSVCIIVP